MEQNRKRQPNGIESVRLGWISLMPIIMGRPWAKNRQRAWLLRVRARAHASKSTVTSSWYVRLQIRVLRQGYRVAARGAARACERGSCAPMGRHPYKTNFRHIIITLRARLMDPLIFHAAYQSRYWLPFFISCVGTSMSAFSDINLWMLNVSKFDVAGLSVWRQISNLYHKREMVRSLNWKMGRKQQL